MKTIITLDRANQPYGFPQLDASASLHYTGSLFGTSSWASNATSASNASTASYVLDAVSASFAQTASYALQALTSSYSDASLSASYAQTASFVTASNLVGVVPVSKGGTNTTSYGVGDILYASATGSLSSLGVGGANTVLHGGPSFPAYSAVVEADISLSDVTTNDATAAKHGFLRRLSGNSSQYLDGNGNFSTPTGVVNSYGSTSFLNTGSVNIIHNYNAYPVVQVLDESGSVLIPQSIINNTLNDFTVTFLTNTSGTIIYSVGAPQPNAYKSVTNTYTASVADFCIEATTGTFNIYLPTAVGNTGRIFKLKNTGTGTVTIIPLIGGQTIDGETSQYLTQYEGMSVMANGVNYIVIG